MGPLAVALGPFFPLLSRHTQSGAVEFSGAGEAGREWGAILADARGKENATLFSRLSKPSHLATAKTRGSVSGPSPHSRRYGCCVGLAGRLKRVKFPLPGFVSPPWVRLEGRRGRGASGSARGRFSQAAEGRMPQEGGSSAVAARNTPRLFPTPTTPPPPKEQAGVGP